MSIIEWVVLVLLFLMIGGSPEQKVSDDLKKMQAIKKHIDTCYQLLLSSKI